MNDISLNKKKKNIKFFDEKKYEMINSFNLDFICNKVDNILSIYEEDKNHKLNHPLLLNGKYCLFCHDKSIKNIFFLEFIHKKIDLEEFLINNGIKFRKVYKKEKICKRRFINSTNKINKNIYEKNNKKSESDTEENFINIKKIDFYEKEETKKSKEKLSKFFISHKKLIRINPEMELKEMNKLSNNSKKKVFTPSENMKLNESNKFFPQNHKQEKFSSSKKLPQIKKFNSVVSPSKKRISLTRKKIENKIIKDITSPINTNNELICNICYDSINDKYTLQCGHYYCKLCLQKFIISCLKNISLFNKIKCLNEFCQQEIKDSILEDLLDEENYEKYKKFQRRITSLSNKKLIPCPYPNCDGYGEKINIKKTYLKCEDCNNIFCINCLKSIYHLNSEEEINVNEINHNCNDIELIEDKITEDFLETNKNIKKCPNCKCWVEKIINNCNNMKCTNLWCNYEFCWICMKKYDNGHYKNPFSQCFGLSQTDINSNFANKGARILKCIIISVIVLFIFFPMFVNLFSFSLISLYLKFYDTSRKKVSLKNKKISYIYMAIEYTFYFLIGVALISLGYLVLMALIIGIPIYILVEKIKNEGF